MDCQTKSLACHSNLFLVIHPPQLLSERVFRLYFRLGLGMFLFFFPILSNAESSVRFILFYFGSHLRRNSSALSVSFHFKLGLNIQLPPVWSAGLCADNKCVERMLAQTQGI